MQLITPILKSYLTDGGFDTASTAMQCFGGYGYIEEYGAAQYLRDARIAMIYEGTNGVQAMDLVGRKLGFEVGRYLSRFFHPVDAFIAENRNDPKMAEFTKPLKIHTKYLQQATMWIGAMGMADQKHRLDKRLYGDAVQHLVRLPRSRMPADALGTVVLDTVARRRASGAAGR